MLKHIEIFISKLKDFKNPKLKLEQYSTPPSTIKDFLLFVEEEIINLCENKEKIKILDCCAGTGFLGISLLLFLNKINPECLKKIEITFLEKDKEAFEILKENIEELKKEFEFNYKLANEDFFEHNERYDLIIMNPPFGIQGKIKDKNFIDKALELSDNVISFHLSGSLDFFSKNYNVEKYLIVNFPIKSQFWFHSKKKKVIQVIIIKILKNKKGNE